MSKQYVIRRIDFSYNDEYYQTNHPHSGAIKQVFQDKNEAEHAFKALVIEELEQVDLEMYDYGFGDADESTYEAVEAFVLEKTGEEYDKDDGIPELEADDLFEFAKLTGIIHYEILEVEENQKYYVIWLNQAGYMTDYDTGHIMYGTHENFIENHELSWHFLAQLPSSLQGSLADLSDAPQLLEQVINKSTHFSYDEAQTCLNIDANRLGYALIAEFNALLKQPLFEIQVKSLDQLQSL